MIFGSSQRPLSIIVFSVLSLALAGRSEAGFITYNVGISTSSISGTSGGLDFQFNPSSAGAQSSTITITHFATDGTLGSVQWESGGASGSLPGAVTITNSALVPNTNELLQSFMYGKALSFEVTLSGPALSQPSIGSDSSLFSLYLLDSGFNPLLTVDPNGSVLGINVAPDGTTAAIVYPATGGGASATTVSPASPTLTVNESPSCLLFSLGLAILGVFWRTEKGPHRKMAAQKMGQLELLPILGWFSSRLASR